MSIDTARNIYAVVIPDDAGHDFDTAPLSTARKVARLCNGLAHALIMGSKPEAAIQAAQALGFDQITTISPANTSTPLQTHQLSDLLFTQLGGENLVAVNPDSILLFAAGAKSEELAGSLAARLQATPLGKCDHFELTGGELKAVRAAFGGRLNINIGCKDGPFIAAVRKTEVTDEVNVLPQVNVRHLAPSSPIKPAYAIEIRTRTEEHASLDGAKLVVSGGRGMGKAENFDLLYEIATKLGGAVGASLPSIDAGWAPVARQVGQSGKYVSPDIYLAVGISGTPQHLAGIDPHTKIIAINKDADASIFQAAYVGVVADWQELLPALAQSLD